MKWLISYFCIVTLVSFILAGLFFLFLRAADLKGKDLSALDYCIDSKEFNNIIFIGGSRVQTHIDPSVIDSANEIKSYCVAVDGVGVVECNMMLNKYLQVHPKPESVFLGIDFNMFYASGPLYNITDYFSYLKDTLIYNCLSPYKLTYRNKLVQYFYLMNKTLAMTDNQKAGRLLQRKNESVNPNFTEKTRGFMGIKREWEKSSEEELNSIIHATHQKEGFQLLRKMIGRCKRDSVKIVFLFSPVYKGVQQSVRNIHEILDSVKTIAGESGVSYWDYSAMSICGSKEYFYDMSHLNARGAEIFSRQLAQDIKKWRK